MNGHCGQEWWSTARFTIRAGTLCLVELRGLEPLTPCLQIAVIGRVMRWELGRCMAVANRGVPAVTSFNGTLMAQAPRSMVRIAVSCLVELRGPTLSLLTRRPEHQLTYQSQLSRKFAE
jgi:hypothetical protein